MIQDAGWNGGQHLMARAYSLDLRERVVAAVAAGESCRAVAATFRVSVASVVKWSQRFRATGSAAAHKVGGRRPYALQGECEWLLARLAEKPAALRRDCIDAPCVIDGPINGESFLAYVEQILIPALKPGDIVIIDNVGSHKGKAVRRAIRAAGAKLFFLPKTWCFRLAPFKALTLYRSRP